jgi:hypothetical protein
MRPDWRRIAEEQEVQRGQPRDEAADQALIARIEQMQEGGRELSEDEGPSSLDDANQVLITRRMPVRRGKWRLVSEEVEQAERSMRAGGSDG